VYSLAKNVAMTYAEIGAVILNERTGRYWLLNDTGATVMSTILSTGSIEHAVEALDSRYHGVAREQIEHDARSLVAQLQTAGLVTS
jgi:hypothetical protein